MTSDADHTPLSIRLYHYLTTRLFLFLGALYFFIRSTSSSSLLCHSDNLAKDSDATFLTEACLYNGTYVYRNKALWSGHPFNAAFRAQGTNSTREQHSYYPHFMCILAAQFCINQVSVILYKSIQMYLSEFNLNPSQKSQLTHFYYTFLKHFLNIISTALPIISICLVMLLLDILYNRHYLFLGFKILQFYFWKENIPEPINEIFPMTAKCSFIYAGLTLQRQHSDVLCILPFNFYHQVFNVTFWFFYVISLSVLLLDAASRILQETIIYMYKYFKK